MTAVNLAAPACKILTVLHVVDPAAPWVEDVKGDGSTYGKTMCGLPLLAREQWQLLEQLPGERICGKCTGEGADDVQEALL